MSNTSSPNQGKNQSTLDSTNLWKQFIEYIDEIITALGITDTSIKQKIKKDMEIFDQKSKYKIISDSALQKNVVKLLEADRKLNDLVKTGGILKTFYDKQENKDAWDNSMKQVARLQGLIILRKISQNDCDGLIKNLLGAFDTKLKAVNTVLESDLKSQAGGSDNDYLVKYLKYKNKYLKLLKNNM
jgi:hypothetical protein